jgi:hypothetical protein
MPVDGNRNVACLFGEKSVCATNAAVRVLAVLETGPDDGVESPLLEYGRVDVLDIGGMALVERDLGQRPAAVVDEEHGIPAGMANDETMQNAREHADSISLVSRARATLSPGRPRLATSQGRSQILDRRYRCCLLPWGA